MMSKDWEFVSNQISTLHIILSKNLTFSSLPSFIYMYIFSLWGFASGSQLSSVSQSYPTLRDPMDYSTPSSPVHHQLPELVQTHVHRFSDGLNLLILCCLLLLPSVFLSIRVFSSESVLHIRWPEYWSFSFSISPSNE